MNKLIEWIKAQLGIETKEEAFVRGYAVGVSHGVIKARTEGTFTGKNPPFPLPKKPVKGAKAK